MHAFKVAYLLPVSRCPDSIDDTVVQMLPELWILTLAEISNELQQRYGFVLVRLYTAQDDLPALLSCIA